MQEKAHQDQKKKMLLTLLYKHKNKQIYPTVSRMVYKMYQRVQH